MKTCQKCKEQWDNEHFEGLTMGISVSDAKTTMHLCNPCCAEFAAYLLLEEDSRDMAIVKIGAFIKS